jgi:Zn ribbon nucleic-acid-binding protein
MNEHSFLVEDQKFVAPIRCSDCDDNARLIRRAPHPFEGLEIRTFECLACGHQMERIVAGEAKLI